MDEVPAPARPVASERLIIAVVAMAQFVNVLEFVIVMPLGPDFAAALSIPANRLSYIATSYTAAAAVAGVLGAFFLDRFGRRRALAVALSGLVIATALGGLARSFPALIAARAVAGLFGGPATSLAMSIVADAVPTERRGRAFSIVLLAFSTAAVVGVPLGLELARHATWRAPLFCIAGLGVIAVIATLQLPPLDAHLRAVVRERAGRAIVRLLGAPIVLYSYAMTFALQTSGFLLIPSLSPYLQLNLGFPRRWLGLLYFVGGLVSAASTRTSGGLVDRYGSLRVATTGLAILTVVIVIAFAHEVPVLVIWPVYCAYMLAQGLRNVAYNTLASKVPGPAERARFQSLQSAVTHFAISCGAGIGGQLLETGPRGELVGMPRIAYLAIAISLSVPLFMWQVERRVNART